MSLAELKENVLSLPPVERHEFVVWVERQKPAFKAKKGKTAAAFKARLNRIAPKPIPGAAEVLQRLRR